MQPKKTDSVKKSKNMGQGFEQLIKMEKTKAAQLLFWECRGKMYTLIWKVMP